MHLIDTHTLIWTLLNSDNLSGSAKETMTDGSKVYVSIASLWEIAIKQSINKLDIKKYRRYNTFAYDLGKIVKLNKLAMCEKCGLYK